MSHSMRSTMILLTIQILKISFRCWFLCVVQIIIQFQKNAVTLAASSLSLPLPLHLVSVSIMNGNDNAVTLVTVMRAIAGSYLRIVILFPSFLVTFDRVTVTIARYLEEQLPLPFLVTDV